jgi:RNA polymerase sigma-70 factor, ECF subfamily
METRDDAELVCAYVNAQDHAAFAELVARHRQMVFRTCCRMLGGSHDAEDAAQAAIPETLLSSIRPAIVNLA